MISLLESQILQIQGQLLLDAAMCLPVSGKCAAEAAKTPPLED